MQLPKVCNGEKIKIFFFDATLKVNSKSVEKAYAFRLLAVAFEFSRIGKNDPPESRELFYGWVRTGTETRENQYGRAESADSVSAPAITLQWQALIFPYGGPDGYLNTIRRNAGRDDADAQPFGMAGRMPVP